jgi:hypothetical protein
MSLFFGIVIEGANLGLFWEFEVIQGDSRGISLPAVAVIRGDLRGFKGIQGDSRGFEGIHIF